MSTANKSTTVDPAFLIIGQDKPGQLELKNVGKHIIVYRLKCTHSIQFAVTPSSVGILVPKQSQSLEINNIASAAISPPSLAAANETPFFLVLETALCRPTATGENFKTEKPDAALAWKDLVWSDVTRTRIPLKLSEKLPESKSLVVCIDRNPIFTKKPYFDRLRSVLERIKREKLTCPSTCLLISSFGAGLATGSAMKRNRILGVMCSMLIFSYALSGIYALNSRSDSSSQKQVKSA